MDTTKPSIDMLRYFTSGGRSLAPSPIAINTVLRPNLHVTYGASVVTNYDKPGMGYDVKVIIDRTLSEGTFTNNDEISGVVKFVTTSPVSLTSIQVKLEGVSTTELIIPDRRHLRVGETNRRRDKREKVLRDVHKVLYDTMVVFPPENVRPVSKAKEFTLPPGNYEYPFRFKIPLASECSKVSGISNKVSFNTKTFDLKINNGNFNTLVIMAAANDYITQLSNPDAHLRNQKSRNHELEQNQYHIVGQLPPTMKVSDKQGSVEYFVKVTCKRLSFLKSNFRAQDPFDFLPLDLDEGGRPLSLQAVERNREIFFRKTFNLHDPSKSLPDPPTNKGFFSSLFGSSSSAPNRHSASSNSFPVHFEVRFKHPALLMPRRPPPFRLFLVTEVPPINFADKAGISNGKGVVYLQGLKIELYSITTISVLESDGSRKEIHQGRCAETIPLCTNQYQNLVLDLKDLRDLKSAFTSGATATASGSYEFEIPKKYYENCTVPRTLAPTFRTCNIARSYSLGVVASFSDTQVTSANDPRVQNVELVCQDVRVLSGINRQSGQQKQNPQASDVDYAAPPEAPRPNNKSSFAPVSERREDEAAPPAYEE